MSLGRTSILAALAFAGGALQAQVQPVERIAQGRRVTETASLLDAFGAVHAQGGFGYRRGPGWTCAQVKRMATKRRNQKRHKNAVRRGNLKQRKAA